MRVIDLALNDLRQLVRDWKTFIFLLVMPVVFTFLFGFAFGGNSTADPRLSLAVWDADNSPLSQRLVAALQASDVVRIDESTVEMDELPQYVADEHVSAAVIIPAGFAAALTTGEAVPVQIIAAGQAGYTAQSEVQEVVSRLASARQAADFSASIAREQGQVDETSAVAYHDAALAKATSAWNNPPVDLRVTAVSALAEQAAESNANTSVFAHSSPGMMAQFAIAGLMGAAGILVVEKKTGSLRRLLTTNMSRGQILLGHFLAMFIMILLQLSVLILFGQLVLDLPYLSQPLATILVTLATAIFCAALGLLIGTISKTEEQAIVFSLVPMFLLAALGGAWVPLEVTPDLFQQVARLTPLAWVIDSYKDILVRGQGVAAVTTAVLVLLVYAVVAAGIAAWRFRAE